MNGKQSKLGGVDSSEEKVVQYIPSFHSLCWNLLQEPINKVFCVSRYVWRKCSCFYSRCHYFFHRLFSAWVVERSVTHQEFICQHSKTPQIDRSAVLVTFKHFWRQIVEGATVSLPATVTHDGPTEVTYLGHPIRQNDIFWLDIAVGDSMRVQIVYPISHVLYVASHLVSLYLSSSLQPAEQMARLHVLEHQVEMSLVAKEAEKLYDEWVIAVHLNLDLSDELFHHGFHDILSNLFQGVQNSSRPMESSIYNSKFSFSQFLSHLKIRTPNFS